MMRQSWAVLVATMVAAGACGDSADSAGARTATDTTAVTAAHLPAGDAADEGDGTAGLTIQPDPAAERSAGAAASGSEADPPVRSASRTGAGGTGVGATGDTRAVDADGAPTGSATAGSATTGSATTGSATTGSATTGSATTGTARGAAMSPDSILRATSRAYEGLRSFRAEFAQTLRNTLLGRTTRSEGTVYQRQPDRFLMDFSDPPEDLIVSDGEWFWMYFPSVDAKQVIRTRRGAQGLDLHTQFIGDPVRRFETTYHGTESVRERPSHVMTLVPREPMGYERLKVWIDTQDHLVRRFELTETNGNIRHFELWDLARNPSLADDLFEFRPPSGAQIVTR